MSLAIVVPGRSNEIRKCSDLRRYRCLHRETIKSGYTQIANTLPMPVLNSVLLAMSSFHRLCCNPSPGMLQIPRVTNNRGRTDRCLASATLLVCKARLFFTLRGNLSTSFFLPPSSTQPGKASKGTTPVLHGNWSPGLLSQRHHRTPSAALSSVSCGLSFSLRPSAQ